MRFNFAKRKKTIKKKQLSVVLVAESPLFSKTPAGANSVNRITGVEKGDVRKKAVKNGLLPPRAGRRS
jgi:hypothetical protein